MILTLNLNILLTTIYGLQLASILVSKPLLEEDFLCQFLDHLQAVNLPWPGATEASAATAEMAETVATAATEAQAAPKVDQADQEDQLAPQAAPQVDQADQEDQVAPQAAPQVDQVDQEDQVAHLLHLLQVLQVPLEFHGQTSIHQATMQHKVHCTSPPHSSCLSRTCSRQTTTYTKERDLLYVNFSTSQIISTEI